MVACGRVVALQFIGRWIKSLQTTWEKYDFKYDFNSEIMFCGFLVAAALANGELRQMLHRNVLQHTTNVIAK